MFNRPQPLQPPPDRAFLRAFVQGVLVLGLIAGLWYWFGREESESSETGPATTIATTALPAAPPPKTHELIKLESTDGRTINAEILVMTDTSIFIRREDGQKFDLPLDRLTPESRQRVTDARTKKIFGVQ